LNAKVIKSRIAKNITYHEMLQKAEKARNHNKDTKIRIEIATNMF